MTHNDLAFELDSAREVVSRKLKDLERQGYLKLGRGKIQIEKDLSEIIKWYSHKINLSLVIRYKYKAVTYFKMKLLRINQFIYIVELDKKL